VRKIVATLLPRHQEAIGFRAMKNDTSTVPESTTPTATPPSKLTTINNPGQSEQRRAMSGSQRVSQKWSKTFGFCVALSR
jgi:hypothetical protein